MQKIFVTKHRLSMQIGTNRTKTSMQVPTELPFCLVGLDLHYPLVDPLDRGLALVPPFKSSDVSLFSLPCNPLPPLRRLRSEYAVLQQNSDIRDEVAEHANFVGKQRYF